jgi:adenylate cyclase class 2
MSPQDEEIEVKFYVRELDGLPDRVLGAGGRLLAPRTYEYNLRFDTPDRSLEHSGRLLRIRRDVRCYLTYKDDTHVENGALRRREIELGVDDFDTCVRLVEALGYEIVFMYEKYRSTYTCGDCKVMLDELPLGHFVEIEGDRSEIEELAGRLGLEWQCAIPRSYYALFRGMRGDAQKSVRDLTFENFAGRAIESEDLGVTPADG